MSGQPQRARGRGGRGQPRQGDGDPPPKQWGPNRGGRGGAPRAGQQGGGAWGQAPGGSQQQQPPPQARGPSTGAWGLRAVQPQPPAFAPRQQERADIPYKQSSGRASQRGVGEQMQPGEREVAMVTTGGGGDGNMALSRGGLRGRREIRPVEIVRTRPTAITKKQAGDGKRISLSSNFFDLVRVPNWTLYQYRVDFAPDVDLTRVRKGMMRTAMEQIMPAHIFDGTIFYCSKRLPTEPYEVFVNSNTDEPIRITLRLRQDVVQYDVLNIQIFNIIIRKCLSFLNMQLVKRSYFDAGAAQRVENHKFEVWPGYETSIRQHEHSIMMNVEIINKSMRVDTALDFLNDVSQNDRGNYQDTFAREIIGTVVLTEYNNKTYLIDDVDWKSTPASSFRRNDGSEITYLEYYAQRYKLNIRDKCQPMLVSRSKPREIRAGMAETVYLVPELCRMTGLTNVQRANYQFMAALAKHTRIGPPDRVQKLMDFHKRLSSHPEIRKELRQWDLQLAETLINFDGRVLENEKIMYGGDDRRGPVSLSTGDDAQWTRDSQKQCMISRAVLTDEKGGWVVMCTKYDVRDVEKFIDAIVQNSRGMGWNIPPPKEWVVIPDDRTGTILKQLEEIITELQPLLIFVAINGNKADRYNAVKKKCYVDYAIPNQVALLRTMKGKAFMSAATKVSVQMNCKLAGAPWAINMPPKDTMYVGFDVCHDPKDRSKNYAAMVASLDQNCTRYYSTVQSHNKGEEISSYFGIVLGNAIREFKKNNGHYPARIIIYRDAVGDGQIPYILEHELEHIKVVLKGLVENYDPKMAFIIVTKRISTRIFSRDTRSGQYSNPPPGTIVDDVVTLPERYDFFLVSQCVRQGTVTPTSYNVIFDNSGFSVSQLQRLTNKLTHMYFNWSGTIRVPALCQYAHKLAFLTSQNLHKAPNPGMADMLFYL